jgi:hypothetical protein
MNVETAGATRPFSIVPTTPCRRPRTDASDGSIARADPDRVNDSLRSTCVEIAIFSTISGRHVPC